MSCRRTSILAKQKARNPACPSLEYVAILGSNIESVKTFSWLQEEVSINIANEIENCLLRPGKDKLYLITLEDVSSYLDKTYGLTRARRIIFR